MSGGDEPHQGMVMNNISVLLPVSGGTAVRSAPPPGKAYLRKRMRCNACGCPMLIERFVPLAPAGVRGYYKCRGPKHHVCSIDRNDVSASVVFDSGDRLWFND